MANCDTFTQSDCVLLVLKLWISPPSNEDNTDPSLILRIYNKWMISVQCMLGVYISGEVAQQETHFLLSDDDDDDEHYQVWNILND